MTLGPAIPVSDVILVTVITYFRRITVITALLNLLGSIFPKTDKRCGGQLDIEQKRKTNGVHLHQPKSK